MVGAVRRERIGELDTYIAETPANGATLVVLCHGYGAGGDDLVPLAHELRLSAPAIWAMPVAPLALAGVYGDARAWWHIDIAALERDMAAGRPRDRREEQPAGMAAARKQLSAVIDALCARFQPKRLVLGGFSQGAMLALETALHRQVPVAGLVLLSGTLINATAWQKRMRNLAKVPVFISHGRRDQLLPFAVAEELSDALADAEAEVTWVPFSGGHEIPPTVLDQLTQFLEELTAG